MYTFLSFRDIKLLSCTALFEFHGHLKRVYNNNVIIRDVNFTRDRLAYIVDESEALVEW